jgi:NAD(P)-dependent dehydrogenase (short-subunit alcohol dehydrogenase family)
VQERARPNADHLGLADHQRAVVVATVRPAGLVRAGFVGKVPLGRLGTVAEVATSYLHLMTNTFRTGQVLVVDGGVSVIT